MAPHALHLAFDLARVPALGEAVARQPLAQGIDELIRIAGGCEDSVSAAAVRTGKSRDAVRRVARLYLQHALFHAGADSYRVLGVSPDAAQATLREHFRWLMRWLHPDRERQNWEAAFAARVLAAWEDVKSPERRARYVSSARPRADERRAREPGLPWIARPRPTAPRRPARRVRVRVVAIAAALAVLVVPGPELPSLGEDIAPLVTGPTDPAVVEPAPRDSGEADAEGAGR